MSSKNDQGQKPGLYGLRHSNRDFTEREAWGKNCFNSSLPASLCTYLHSKGLESVYIKLSSNLSVEHSSISATELYGIDPNSENLFYAFETQFTPYQKHLIGDLPRVDLVTQRRDRGECLQAIEIKLTALPDNTTCDLPEDRYGCEIVIRPDTIVYLACHICDIMNNLNWVNIPINGLMAEQFTRIADWTEPDLVIPHIPDMIEVIDSLARSMLEYQQPFVMQPIWKTEGKCPKLSENCLDVFVWSDLAFTRLFIDVAKKDIRSTGIKKISRQVRAIIWLFKMLHDFSIYNQFDHKKIMNSLAYNLQSDKAFSVVGKSTRIYMESEILHRPRVHQREIKKIILGGGQNLLSPERRFDAIIYSSPDLFE